jgi:hypothetical protein
MMIKSVTEEMPWVSVNAVFNNYPSPELRETIRFVIGEQATTWHSFIPIPSHSTQVSPASRVLPGFSE